LLLLAVRGGMKLKPAKKPDYGLRGPHTPKLKFSRTFIQRPQEVRDAILKPD
jgi:hypothetical protein